LQQALGGPAGPRSRGAGTGLGGCGHAGVER
jgi:hypothetical protein